MTLQSIPMDMHVHLKTGSRMYPETVLSALELALISMPGDTTGLALTNFSDYRYEEVLENLGILNLVRCEFGNAALVQVRPGVLELGDTEKYVLLVKSQEVEVNHRGSPAHILGIGLPYGINVEDGRDTGHTIEKIKKYGALAVIPHPFSSHSGLFRGLSPCKVDPFLVRDFDALETWNSAIPTELNNKAKVVYFQNRQLGRKLGFTIGSDSHTVNAMGTSYQVLQLDLSSADSLLQSMRDSIQSPDTDFQQKRSYIDPLTHAIALGVYNGLGLSKRINRGRLWFTPQGKQVRE